MPALEETVAAQVHLDHMRELGTRSIKTLSAGHDNEGQNGNNND